jgi:type III restriction enzyme
VEDVAHDVYERLRSIDDEKGTDYSRQFPKARIAEIIKKSLEHVKDKTGKVSEANYNRTIAAFGVIERKSAKTLRFTIEAQDLVKISTAKMSKTSTGVGALRRDETVVYDEYSMQLGEAADRKQLKELREDDGLRQGALLNVPNKYNFKTPLNVVLVSFDPERRFVRELTSDRTAKVIDAWIKSPDIGFYSIEYSWRKGEHPKQGSFNPDFFIKLGEHILVIETKMDDDVSEENKAKLKYAREHFARVNELQKEQQYCFKFLSPSSYELFFKSLNDKTYTDFKSDLEAKLEG